MSDQSPVVIGIDASTTACKVLLVDGEGRSIGEGRAGYTLDNPAPGAWEQDANEWTRALFASLEQALRPLDGPTRSRIGAMAIAHQRETFVAVDAAGKPVRPAVVWMDSRATREVSEAQNELAGDRIHRLSGKVPCTTPSLYKLRALITRLDVETMKRARHVLDVHAFLVRELTGELCTSRASADPMGLVDMQDGSYASELCDLARVSERMLAPMVLPGTTIGTLLPEHAARLGLDPSVRVVAGAGDGQAAGLGAGVFAGSDAYLNLGTALVAGRPAADYVTDRAFRTLYAATPEGYLLETDLKGGTLSLDWLADRLLGGGTLGDDAQKSARLAELERQATHLPPGSQGLLFLPYLAGVMNPHWDDDTGGALIGLRTDHTPAHLYRAICEGLAFEQHAALLAVEQASGPLARLVLMGGASRSPMVRQIFADVLGRRLERCGSSEVSARGAAALAMPAVDACESVEAAARLVASTEGAVLPGPLRERYQALYRDAYVDCYATLRSRLGALARVRD